MMMTFLSVSLAIHGVVLPIALSISVRAFNKSTRVAIVGVFGVSTICEGAALEKSIAAGVGTVTASVLAAYPQVMQRTNVSSPTSRGAKNSSLFDPPMAPDIAETMTKGRCRRSKVLMYAARWAS